MHKIPEMKDIWKIHINPLSLSHPNNFTFSSCFLQSSHSTWMFLFILNTKNPFCHIKNIWFNQIISSLLTCMTDSSSSDTAIIQNAPLTMKLKSWINSFKYVVIKILFNFIFVSWTNFSTLKGTSVSSLYMPMSKQ